MAWTSTQPAAIANLVTSLQASADLAGVPVKDGPVVSGETLTELIVVGFDGEAGAAVEGSLTYEGMTISPSRENYTISGVAQVLRGGGDIAVARKRAYELLAAIGGELARDKTLGGVVMSATLGDVSLSQTQSPKGAVASVTFGVACDGWTGR